MMKINENRGTSTEIVKHRRTSMKIGDRQHTSAKIGEHHFHQNRSGSLWEYPGTFPASQNHVLSRKAASDKKTYFFRPDFLSSDRRAPLE